MSTVRREKPVLKGGVVEKEIKEPEPITGMYLGVWREDISRPSDNKIQKPNEGSGNLLPPQYITQQQGPGYNHGRRKSLTSPERYSVSNVSGSFNSS